MGQKSDEIAREIASRRAAIDQKLASLEHRIRDDATEVKSTATERIPQPLHVREMVEKRPLTSVLAGFGVGLALGRLSPNPLPAAGKAASATTNGATALGAGMFSSAFLPLQGEIQEQISRYVREFTSGLTSDEPRASAS